MKPKLKIGMAVAVLATASCFAIPKAMPINAEGSAEESSLISSINQSVQDSSVSIDSSSSKPKADWGEIEVDGKTLNQWKTELADEATRKSAIIALAEFVGFALVMLLVKLVQHKDIIANKANLGKTAELLACMTKDSDDAKKVLDESKKALEQAEKVMAEYKGAVEEETKKAMRELVSQVEALQSTMLVLLKNTPDFINQDAYKQALEALDGKQGE